MGMSGVVRKRSKMVADGVQYLVGEDVGWVKECDVMKRWKVCDNGLLRSNMLMLKSHRQECAGYSASWIRCCRRYRVQTGMEQQADNRST